MKRSEINAHIRSAEQRFASGGLFLPEWAHWSPLDWFENREHTQSIVAANLGWDLTDFGKGNFQKLGLLLFTVRNGIPGVAGTVPYAEKLMIVGEGQVTPLHFHWTKTEDIINRGGGDLVLELVMGDEESEEKKPDDFVVHRDGLRIECSPADRIRLKPGQSITLTPYLYHAFWAERDTCIVGEVSSVNDDASDNRFYDPLGRFPSIDEDEEPYRLLCTDYERFLS